MLTIKFILQEVNHLLQLLIRATSFIKTTQISECLSLQRNEHTSQQTFIGYGIILQTIGYHIINILDKYDVSIQIIQVLDKCAMATGTEYQTTIGISKWFVILIGSYRIGTCLLLREGDIVLHTESLLIASQHGIDTCLEELTMLRRNSKVDMYILVLILCIESTLYEMFFKRSTHSTILIEMEEKQPFRQLAKVQSFGIKQCRYHLTVTSLSHQSIDIHTIQFHTLIVKCGVESEKLYMVKKDMLKICHRLIMTSIEKFEKILKHTTGRSRCGNKFHNIVITLKVSIPISSSFLYNSFVGFYNTFFHRSRSF